MSTEMMQLQGDKDYDPKFFSELEKVEDGHFWFEARNRLIEYMMSRFFKRSGKFLEIGVGTGFVLRSISKNSPQMEVIGSEIHAEALGLAAKRLPNARLIQCDAREIPFKNELNIIGAFDVIEHIEEDEQVLQSMHQALVPGGGVILTVPQHMFLWSEFDTQGLHKRRYSRKELTQKLSRAGFEVSYATSFLTLLFPLLFLSRLSKRKKDTDTMSEHKVGYLFNRILSIVMRIEYFLVRYLKFSLPFGGSLVVVAKKK
jgi:SAM-dependent methyltransferase